MAEAQRNARLNKHFHDVLSGKQKPTGNNLFLEAICAQPEVVACVEKLISSSHGLEAMKSCLHRDNALVFLNGHATQVLKYLQVPQLRTVHSGEFLRKIVKAIVDPPVFWSPLLAAFHNGKLLGDGQLSFVWLLLELVRLPEEDAQPYLRIAADPATTSALAGATHPNVAPLVRLLQHILDGHSAADVSDAQAGPGGRHDNDFADFRQIAILPTALEVGCQQAPFLRTSGALDAMKLGPTQLSTYLDNQFRLLREDMLYELREGTQLALGEKKGRTRGMVFKDVKLVGMYFGDPQRRVLWGLQFQCSEDLPQLKAAKDRVKFLKEAENRNKIARHGSLTCILADNQVIGFGTIHRDEDLLAKKLPNLVIQFPIACSLTDMLLRMKTAKELSIVQIDAAVFAYEPVLRALQATFTMPLSPELLFWHDGDDIGTPPSKPDQIIQALLRNSNANLKPLLQLKKDVCLDSSQSTSLLTGLRQNVSLIQGPPGTGKSFLGALLAKAVYDYTDSRILVVCYTNHALDQFLEDLLDIGIPANAMVRLGGKSTPRTSSLGLASQPSSFTPTRAHYVLRDESRTMAEINIQDVGRYYGNYAVPVSMDEIMAYLEFEAPDYFEAFTVPSSEDGMIQVDSHGRDLTSTYLIDRWQRGEHAGIFRKHPNFQSPIWKMVRPSRHEMLAGWRNEIAKENAANLQSSIGRYNKVIGDIVALGSERDASKLRDKRIIACTTTGAAKYTEMIQAAASPHVVLVEEAGEILESHVLTALGPETRQLILIGDHKQLRPKFNKYELTFEKGDGFDLNISLFERLVLRGFPHETLSTQHRMRPEISSLVRQLMYPDLADAPGTRNRPDIRGLQDNVVFINHSRPEDDDRAITDKREGNTSSKTNSHEVAMVLKIVRYLAQQGYGTSDIVVLTPYLGNLRKIFAELRRTTDAVLNDLDNAELVKAGLVTPAAANAAKKGIRLATIDNYQGEESKIVVASLTRSNPRGDIGFMSAAERLNVLLSRARDGLILIGNADTFMKSRKGGDTWKKLFGLLKADNHMFDGLPVQCERHPDKKTTLKMPEDFDKDCPDGGCDAPCGEKQRCGHPCPSKCHAIIDHSKMDCHLVQERTCSEGHQQKWKCFQGIPAVCAKCEKKKKEAEAKLRRDVELQQKREVDQRRHDAEMAKLEEQQEEQRALIRDAQLATERRAAVAQKRRDLETTKDSAARYAARPPTPTPTSTPPPPPPPSLPHNSPQPSPPSAGVLSAVRSGLSAVRNTLIPSATAPSTSDSNGRPALHSPSRDEWERLKAVDVQKNDALDELMALTGLEEVKAKALEIKHKIDTLNRQGALLKGERFNAVFLGNPGTGKTTVARIYAKLLASLGVLPGNDFVETTGARIASDGVQEAKKMIAKVLSNGGGAIFCDESYQLVGKSGGGMGSQVLDFLLAEMENNTDKLVFIFAGYKREMEEFFAHNPGLPSRVPYSLKFEDYNDAELLDMFKNIIIKKYSGRMKLEEGLDGLYARIAVRRLGRGRGQPGFGNARALQNLAKTITDRQATRLTKERRSGAQPDDLLLTQEDLIGPEPTRAVEESSAWKELQKQIGLGSVKASVRALLDMITLNYRRDLKEMEPSQVSLNRVFLGSPGTGKTTVAKLYGQILADLGLLSNGEVVVKNPADFVGSALGQSEEKTKGILASSLGKVLVIDEAYMLYSGKNTTDPYRTAVVDTMVAEIQSTPGEDRCVLLLGYKPQMEEMFQNVNPGLARRFAIEDAFTFDDFTDEELGKILDLKLNKQQLDAKPDAKRAALELLSRQRNRPNFGNGGAVENALSMAKTRFQQRQSGLPFAARSVSIIFEPEDFDPDHNRQANAAVNVSSLFNDIVGRDDIVTKLQEFVNIAITTKKRGKDVRDFVPTCFIFKGPPGTGKTTIARKFGQVYYDLGFLSSTEVLECSASDLVGQYVGQTGPKVVQLLDRALGRVCFIDEAYRLREGHFAKEAVDELVGLLTQDKYKGKVIVILAGYDEEMNELLSVNPGLSSRFPHEFTFTNMTPGACLEILTKKLAKDAIMLPELDNPESPFYQQLVEIIKQLAVLPSWGNARDMETIAKAVAGRAFQDASNIQPDGSMLAKQGDAVDELQAMLNSRKKRDAAKGPGWASRMLSSLAPWAQQEAPPQTAPPPPPPAPPQVITRQAVDTKEAEPEQMPAVAEDVVQRDAGVSDATWNQLQLDKRLQEEAQRAAREAEAELERQQQEAAAREAKERAIREKLEQQARQAQEEKQREAARRAFLEARRREEQERIRRAEIAAQLEAQRRAIEQERKAQQKLRTMGICPAGFQWVKQAGGYRCTAGGHFVSDSELNLA
ncbi:P-loop containing nucleoside triphosphate hydrolase protein [Auricularia subglabra TFB-10046 SS5]|nr:P-loop containing nucleoside triphosphate hydrolase protein [Auricularia subglabra TFB-10046 SS5]